MNNKRTRKEKSKEISSESESDESMRLSGRSATEEEARAALPLGGWCLYVRSCRARRVRDAKTVRTAK